jgi:hypothetical protein
MTRAVDYWELSEKERAALTRDQCAKFIDFELMQKGVLALEPLELVQVPEPELETTTYYRLRSGPFHSIALAFLHESHARGVLEYGPIVISSEYLGGESIEFVESCEWTIESVELPRKATIDAARLVLKEATEAKTENERRTRAHAEQGKAVETATRGLWEDWYACRKKAGDVAKIEATFTKYTGLAGSEETAMKFLRTVFPVAQIAEAETWTGRDMGSKRDFPEMPVAPAASATDVSPADSF